MHMFHNDVLHVGISKLVCINDHRDKMLCENHIASLSQDDASCTRTMTLA